MTTTDLLLIVGELRARVAALEARLSPEPVTSWRGAAAVLGLGARENRSRSNVIAWLVDLGIRTASSASAA